MTRTFPGVPWCRYADDGLVHCRTGQEAQVITDALKAGLAECHLEMHPDKTQIICDLSHPAECQNYFAAAGYGFT